MAAFEPAFDHVQEKEGWYSNHKLDTGKETIGGISRKHHPYWPGWSTLDSAKRNGNVNSLKHDSRFQKQIRDFYQNEFWDKLKASQIRHDSIGRELFDTAVNMGINRAVKIVQEACNLTNRNRGSDLKVDGKIGSKTLRAINEHPRPVNLYRTMNILQGEFYVNICRKRKSQRVFFNGWISTRIDM